MEDPPWLDPTRKFLKIDTRRLPVRAMKYLIEKWFSSFSSPISENKYFSRFSSFSSFSSPCGHPDIVMWVERGEKNINKWRDCEHKVDLSLTKSPCWTRSRICTCKNMKIRFMAPLLEPIRLLIFFQVDNKVCYLWYIQRSKYGLLYKFKLTVFNPPLYNFCWKFWCPWWKLPPYL